jgi:dipeptidyl aminopeptidase/acylaminoacyl peptidase
MKKMLVSLTVVVTVLSLTVAVFVVRPFARVSDPADARCDTPQPSFGEPESSSSHDEVDVHFTCAGAVQAATLYLPKGHGPHPAVVWVHGSGPMTRLKFNPPGIVPTLVQSGVAVLSYDKRGAGESEGNCCPGDDGHFNVLAADASGAINALQSRPDNDPARIGLIGASQAGWIIPLTVARSGDVAFTAMVDAPTVSYGLEGAYSRLTGEQGGGTARSDEQIAERLASITPSGFDPAPLLEQITVPGLWIYGGEDRSQPTSKSVQILDGLKAAGKDFTVIVYPHAGHGLLDTRPSDPRALPTIVDWISEHVQSTEK